MWTLRRHYQLIMRKDVKRQISKKNLIFNLRAHSRFVDAFIKIK